MRKALIMFSMLALILIVSGKVSADTEKGSDIIPPGDSLIFEIEHSGRISLRYSVKVNSGPDIDVIVTDEVGFEQYKDPFSKMYYISSYSSLGTGDAHFSGNIAEGHYFIILDNTERGEGNPRNKPVEIEYIIEWRPAGLIGTMAGTGTYGPFDWPMLIMATLATRVALLLILIIAGIIPIRHKLPKAVIEDVETASEIVSENDR